MEVDGDKEDLARQLREERIAGKKRDEEMAEMRALLAKLTQAAKPVSVDTDEENNGGTAKCDDKIDGASSKRHKTSKLQTAQASVSKITQDGS